MQKLRFLRVAAVLLALLCVGAGMLGAQNIRVGVIYPLTGQAAAYGEDGKKACQVAEDQINAAGGINGRKLEFLFEDDRGEPKGGVAAAQKLIEINKVNAIIGPLFSSIVLAVKPIAVANKVPVIAPLAGHPELFSEKGFIFSLDAAAEEVGYVEAKYWTEEKKMKRTAVLYEMSDNPLLQVQSFTKAWESFGGRVVASETYNAGSSDFRMQITKIKAAKPDFVLLRGADADLVRVIRQMAELNFTVPLEADTQVQNSGFVDAVGSIVDGRLTICNFAAPDSAESKAAKATFEMDFKKRHGVDPQFVAYHTYDACRLLFAAMKASSAAGEALRAALAKTSIEGTTGTFHIQSNGMSGRGVTFSRLVGGQWVPTGYVASKIRS